MIHGMSRDAWNEFSKTILVRYVLSYLCGTLDLDPSVSLKRIFAFSVGHVDIFFSNYYNLQSVYFELDQNSTNNEKK